MTYSLPVTGRAWVFEPSLGVGWQSRDLVDYYYGVRGVETRPGRPAYSGGATSNAFAKLSLSYMLTSGWSVYGGGEYTYLGKNISDSPIVERRYETGVFLGLTYEF